MRDTHLRNIDLNLLRAIQPLLEERHISRAAKRAFLSQPAMSCALNRLTGKVWRSSACPFRWHL